MSRSLTTPRLARSAAAVLLASLACPLATEAQDCRLGAQPAATLLYPYFEVDLEGGRTTLIAIQNRLTGIPVLSRVTLWTDWGIPTLAFDVFLTTGDTQTINLRDIFTTGSAPVTGPGASIFPGCGSTLGGFQITPVILQSAHTGRNTLGSCFASSRPDTTIATGYVTVDATLRCPSPSTTPESAGYFSGAGKIAANDNVLWGRHPDGRPGRQLRRRSPGGAHRRRPGTLRLWRLHLLRQVRRLRRQRRPHPARRALG